MNLKKLFVPALSLVFVVVLGVWWFRPGAARVEQAVQSPETPVFQAPAASQVSPATPETPLSDEAAPAQAPQTPQTTVPRRRVTPREALLAGSATVSESPPVPAGENLVRRHRVVRVAEGVFKHPYVRVTETYRLTPDEWARDPELRWVGDDRLVDALEEVADHVVVRVREGMNAELLRDALEGTGLEVYQELRTPGTFILRVPFHSVQAIGHGLRVAEGLPDVIASAQPNTIFHAAFTTPDDLAENLWGLWNNSNDHHISAPYAWDLTTGSRDIIVAVIDTGVDYRHPDLAANMWTNPDPNAQDVHGYDFYNRNPDPLDDHGHGTHCAGTIGAVGNNNLGIVGVNWEVSIMGIKFLSRTGSGSLADAVDAVNYATEKGAHLTNNSWGAATDPNREGDLLREAFANQLAAGIGVIAAAGNSFSDNAIRPQVPAAYPLFEEGLISVAASDFGGTRAPFSNFGVTTVDLAAPGASIYSTLPENEYASWSGTSMAAPHVAGVYALLLDVFPSLSPAEVRTILMESVDTTDHWGDLVRSGGRLNAFSSVQRVGGGPLVYLNTESLTESGGDGVISPGETVTYTLSAENVSYTYDSDNVQATAAVTQGADWLTLTTGALSFGDIAVRSLSTGTQNLVFTVHPDTPTPLEYAIELTVTDADLNTWTQTLSGTVYTITSIAGEVRLDGVPEEGVTLRYQGKRSGTLTTGSDGRYQISGLVDGAYQVRAERGGWVATDWTNVSLLPDASGVDFDFTTVTVSGQVRESGGAGIGNATVHYSGALSGTETVDVGGNYTISRVFGRGGTLSVRARVPGGVESAARSLAMLPPDTRSGEDFVFDSVVISGIVRDAGTLVPVNGAVVALSQAASQSLVTGADGLFAFTVLAGRTAQIRLEAYKPDVYRPSHQILTVPPSHENLTLDLESGWYQSFRIPNPHVGLPIEGDNTEMKPYLYKMNDNIELVAQGGFGPANMMLGAMIYRHHQGQQWDVVHDRLGQALSSLRGINDNGDAAGFYNVDQHGQQQWNMWGLYNGTIHNPFRQAFSSDVIDNDGRIFGLTYSGQMFMYERGQGLRAPINSPHTPARIYVHDVNRHGQMIFDTVYYGNPVERIWAIGTLEEIEAGTYKIIVRDDTTDRNVWNFQRISHNGDALGFKYVSAIGGGVEAREMWMYDAVADGLVQMPWPDWAANSHMDFANDFNSRLDAVGSDSGSGLDGRPWLYRNGSFTDLREMVPASDILHTKMNRPMLINDDGVIAGVYVTPRNTVEMFLLIPPPEVEPGRLQFADTRPEVREDAGTVTLTVQRVSGILGDISVDYRTVNETAEAGLDYVATTGTLYWEAGDDSDRTIEVTLLDDEIPEGRETFLVELFNPTGDAIVALGSVALVTILDTDLPDHLVAHWRLDESAGSTAGDSALNGNDGAFTGSPQWVPGLINNALRFNAGDGVRAGTRFFRPESGTVALWARLDGGSGVRRMFYHRTDSQFANRISLGVNASGQLVAGIGDRETAFTGAALGGELTHVALTWDNGSFTVYRDGQPVGSGSYEPFFNLMSFCWLGRGGLNNNESWVGLLDDVRVYDAALAGGDIEALYNAGWQLQAPVFFVQPLSRTVQENASVTFTAEAHGNPVPTLQWFRNGVALAGETGTSLTVTAPLSDDGVVYHAEASNSVAADISSAEAVLTVTPDEDAPVFRLARVLQGGEQVWVRFDEVVSAASAENIAHYSISNGVTVTDAEVRPGGKDVLLTVSGLADGWAGTLTVDGLTDIAATPNPVQNQTLPLAYDLRLGSHFRMDDPQDGALVDSAFEGNDAALALTAGEPGSGPGGVTAWNFDGSGSAAAPTAGLSGARGTVSVWMRSDDLGTTERHAFWHRAGNSSSRIGLSQRNGRLYYHIGERASRDTGVNLGTGWNQALLMWDNGNYAVWLNGERIRTGTYTPFAGIDSGMFIGGTGAGSYWMGGLNDLRVYNVALDDLSAARLYDPEIIASAPVFTRQPQSVFVQEGQTVTFSAAAVGLPYPSYQWQRNGVDLPGETGPSLSLVANFADNGAEFRVVASNSVGSATSQAATLGMLSDSTPPAVTSVSVVTRRRVQVNFSEAVESGSATTPGHYTINGETVLEAIQRSATQVELVAAQTFVDGVQNMLVINHVTDTAPSPNPIAENTTRTFTYNLAGHLRFHYNFEDPITLGTTEGRFINSVTGDNNRRWFDSTRMETETVASRDGYGLALKMDSRYFSSGFGHSDHLNGRRGAYAAWVNYNNSHYPFNDDWTKTIFGCTGAVNRLNLVLSSNHRLQADLGNANAVFVADSAFPNNQWVHVALVWDHGTFQVYQNGVLAGEGVYNEFDTAGISVRLATGTTSGFGNWRGLLDDMRIYSTSLSAADVKSIYNEAFDSYPPHLLREPIDQTVVEGGSVTFSVIADGEPAPTFQWRKDDVDIPGATSATLTLNNLAAPNAGGYDVVVSNSEGGVTSRTAVLTVLPAGVPPVVTLTAPAPGAVIMLGEAIDLTATASDADGDLKEVRFYGDGQLLSTQVDPPYAHTWINAFVGERVVRAEARDLSGNVASDEVTLEVHAEPMILKHPEDIFVSQGARGVLRVEVLGYPAPEVQWRRNGVDLPGGTGVELVLEDMTLADAGLYDAVVVNPYGTQTSYSAEVRVLPMDVVTPSELFLINQGFVTVQNGVRILARQTDEESVDVFQGYVGNFPAKTLEREGDRIELSFTLRANTPESGRQVSFGFFAGDAVFDHAATATTGQWQGYFHQLGTRSGATHIQGGVFRQGFGPTGLMDFANGGSSFDGAGGSPTLSPLHRTQSSEIIVQIERISSTELMLTTVYPSPRQDHEVSGTATGVPYDLLTVNNLATLRSWYNVNEGPLNLNGFAIAGRGDLWELSDVRVRTSGDIVQVPTPPQITAQPQPQTVGVGGSAGFSVSVTGYPFPEFQWRKDGLDLDGANGATLTLTDVTVEDAGSYSVFIWNENGYVTSEAAILTVLEPPSAPENLQAESVSSSEILLTWSEPDDPMDGFRVERSANGSSGWSVRATVETASYSDTGLEPDSTWYYRVIALRDGLESVPSSVASATTLPPPPEAPMITTPLVDQTVTEGAEVILSVTATGYPAPTFAWTKDGQPLGESTATLNLGSVSLTDAGTYAVTATNSAGSDSSGMELTVQEAPEGGLLLEEFFLYGTSMLQDNYGDWQDGTTIVRYEGSPNGLFAHDAFAAEDNSQGTLRVDSNGGVRGVQREVTDEGLEGVFWVSALMRKAQTGANSPLFIALHDSDQTYFYDQPRKAGFGLSGDGTNVVPVYRAADGTLTHGAANGYAVNTYHLVIAKVTIGEGADTLRLWVKKTTDTFETSEASLGTPVLTVTDADFGDALRHLFVAQHNVGGTNYVDAIRIASGDAGLALVLGQEVAPPPPEPPPAPTGLAAQAVSSSRIELTWSDSADPVDGFRLERSLDGEPWAVATTVEATTHSDTGLAAHTWYSYRVIALRDGMESPPSAVATARTWTVYGFPDDDGDGIDDNWESLHFPDGDMPETLPRRGVETPIREIFIVGLNPDDEEDVFEIGGFDPISSLLQFEARDGREYRILGSQELGAEADWQELVGWGDEPVLNLNGASRMFLKLEVRLAMP